MKLRFAGLFFLLTLTAPHARAAGDVKVQLVESTDGKTPQTLVVINCPKESKADHVIVETLYAATVKVGDKDVPIVRLQTDVGSFIAGVEYGVGALPVPKSVIKKVTVTLVSDMDKTVVQFANGGSSSGSK